MTRGFLDIDIRELKKFKDSLEKLKSDTKREMAQLLDLNTNRMVADIKRNTPVDTGLLRNSFERTEIQGNEQGFQTEVSTNLEYAPYIEYGHRMKGGGFVKGHFMVYEAEKRIQKRIDQDVRNLVIKLGRTLK